MSPEEKNPNDQMAQNYNYNEQSEFAIKKEREFEKVKNHLIGEFQQLDINHDDKITIEEVAEFLRKRAKGKIDLAIVQTLFDEMDKDENGHISLHEFVGAYFDQQMEVEMRIEQLN